MTDNPIKNAIIWNRSQQQRAERDAKSATRVPRSYTRREYRGGRPVDVPLTVEQYREVRLEDASRFSHNIWQLENLLAA